MNYLASTLSVQVFRTSESSILASSTDDRTQNNYDCHVKVDSTFIKFISLIMWMFYFFPLFFDRFLSKILNAAFIMKPTSPVSTYHWNITDQFSKNINSNHFCSPYSFLKSLKMNSHVVSSTCRWPIYVVIPKTVCLEFMLATAQQCWAFSNSFGFFTCMHSGRKHYFFF